MINDVFNVFSPECIQTFGRKQDDTERTYICWSQSLMLTPNGSGDPTEIPAFARCRYVFDCKSVKASVIFLRRRNLLGICDSFYDILSYPMQSHLEV